MKCSKCNFENPEKSKFCGKCGKTLSKGGISKTTIFAVFIIVGVLALAMMYLPSSDKKGDDGGIIQTPAIKDTTTPESNVASTGSTSTSPGPTSIILENSAPVLTRIIVSPSTFSIAPGNTKDFYYVANDQFGKIFQTTVTWTSSDTRVGIIDNKGVFTSRAPGTTVITASSGTVSGTATVTVTTPDAVLTTITVSPATASVVAGNSQTFIASPQDQFGKPMKATITWSSSNIGVGTIDSNGLFTSKTAGTSTITASSGTVSGTATVTVTTPSPVLTMITVSPATASIVEGNIQLFNAVTLDQFNNPIVVSVTWSSSNNGVGTIDSSGRFTAKAAGSTTITASSGSVSGTASVTVTRQVPQTIKVSPATVSLVVGNTQAFTAVTLDQFNKPIASTVTWSSSNSAVGSIDTSGKFTALTAGTTTVTASSGSVSGTADVTVIPVPPTDQISNFRVSSTSNKELLVTVDYSYNTDHGTNVFMAAYPLIGGQKQISFGYVPAKVNIGTGSGTIKVIFGYNNPPASVTTDQIQVDIYVGGQYAFYSQKFDYSKTWSQGLATPTQISPADGSVFSIFPRTTTLTWSAVSGAASYSVEVDCFHCCKAGAWCSDVGGATNIGSNLQTTSYTFDYVGAQPGRWRVWSVDASGKESPKSGWWGFSYTI